MNSFLFLLSVFSFFILVSTLAFRKAHLMAGFFFYMGVCVYLVLIYLYYELINDIHSNLRDQDIYVELGHASLSLILTMFLSYIAGIAFVAFAIVKRRSFRQLK
jgi:Ca2+/Na+ antiporter